MCQGNRNTTRMWKFIPFLSKYFWKNILISFVILIPEEQIHIWIIINRQSKSWGRSWSFYFKKLACNSVLFLCEKNGKDEKIILLSLLTRISEKLLFNLKVLKLKLKFVNVNTSVRLSLWWKQMGGEANWKHIYFHTDNTTPSN